MESERGAPPLRTDSPLSIVYIYTPSTPSGQNRKSRRQRKTAQLALWAGHHQRYSQAESTRLRINPDFDLCGYPSTELLIYVYNIYVYILLAQSKMNYNFKRFYQNLYSLFRVIGSDLVLLFFPIRFIRFQYRETKTSLALGFFVLLKLSQYCFN